MNASVHGSVPMSASVSAVAGWTVYLQFRGGEGPVFCVEASAGTGSGAGRLRARGVFDMSYAIPKAEVER